MSVDKINEWAARVATFTIPPLMVAAILFLHSVQTRLVSIEVKLDAIEKSRITSDQHEALKARVERNEDEILTLRRRIEELH